MNNCNSTPAPLKVMDELYSLIEVHGYNIYSLYKHFLQAIADFEVRDTDVFIISFPKSGTTWTQEMTWLLLNDLNYQGAEKLLDERSPYLEGFVYGGLMDPESKDPRFWFQKMMSESFELVRNLPDPRLIKMHVPWPFLPKQLRDKTKKAKIIYVNRNPKDVCISYLHHKNMLSGMEEIPVETYCEDFMSNKDCFCPYWKHVLTFWNMRDEPNILFLRYEDMKKDLISVIKRVSKFLGKQYDDEQIGKLAEHLSFENMKNNPAVNKNSLFAAMGAIPENQNFVRRGVVGSHKTEMPEEYIKKFDKWIEVHFGGTGLVYE